MPAGQTGWQAVLPHQRRLLALAVASGATPDTARDVVQEALLRTATRTQLDPEHVGAYLTVVVHRLLTDQHRREQQQQHLAQHRQLELAHQPGPEETTCQQAEAAWVQQQTNRLPCRERQALLLRGAGRSTSQIATEFGVSAKAIECLIRRARTTLRILLASTLTLLLWGTTTGPAVTHRPPGKLLNANNTHRQLLRRATT